MGAHLILMGPSGAGKSSLLRGLVGESAGAAFNYTIDREWVTRSRRSGEDDREYDFVTPEKMELYRCRLLMIDPPYSEYKCALEWPQRLEKNEVRGRCLLPANARIFLGSIALDSPDSNVICCAVVPPARTDLEARIMARDSTVPPVTLERRLAAADGEMREAQELADLTFENADGLDRSVAAFRSLIENYCIERGF